MRLLLRGADLPELGVVASRAVGARLAIALTRGRHAKSYHYTDPNEDVVGVYEDDDATALVVADGHNGTFASHQAVPAMLTAIGSGDDLRRRVEAVKVLHGLNSRLAEQPRRRHPSRTTLSAAVLVDGGAALVHLSVGDSPVVLVRDGRAVALTRDRPHFLGEDLSVPMVAGTLEHGVTDIREGDVVLIVSDGYTNFAPLDDLPGLVEGSVDAETTARAVIDRAGQGGAGDNVAVAVLRR
jgi:serine/threonine protein phosphatase PrpC